MRKGHRSGRQPPPCRTSAARGGRTGTLPSLRPTCQAPSVIESNRQHGHKPEPGHNSVGKLRAADRSTAAAEAWHEAYRAFRPKSCLVTSKRRRPARSSGMSELRGGPGGGAFLRELSLALALALVISVDQLSLSSATSNSSTISPKTLVTRVTTPPPPNFFLQQVQFLSQPQAGISDHGE